MLPESTDPQNPTSAPEPLESPELTAPEQPTVEPQIIPDTPVYDLMEHTDPESIVDTLAFDLSTQQKYPMINYGGGVVTDEETIRQEYQLYGEQMLKMNEQAFINKKQTSQALAGAMGLPADWVYNNFSTVMQDLAPGVHSEASFADNLRAVWQQGMLTSEINMLRSQQLYGDRDYDLELQIRALKVRTPKTTAIDTISQSLSEKGLLGKFVGAWGAVGYFAASQLPRMVSQWKYGLSTGAALAAAGAVTGVGAAVLGKVGFAVGSFASGFMQEAGAMWDELQSQQNLKGIEVDEDVSAAGISIASAFINAIDLIGVFQIAGTAAKSIGQLSADAIKEQAFKKYMFSSFGKDVLKGMAAEGIPEGMQEVLNDMAMYAIAVEHDKLGEYGLDRATAREMFDNAMLVTALSLPVAGLAAGTGSAFSSARGYVAGSRIIRIEEKARKIADAEGKNPETATVPDTVEPAVDPDIDFDLDDTEIVDVPIKPDSKTSAGVSFDEFNAMLDASNKVVGEVIEAMGLDPKMTSEELQARIGVTKDNHGRKSVSAKSAKALGPLASMLKGYSFQAIDASGNALFRNGAGDYQIIENTKAKFGIEMIDFVEIMTTLDEQVKIDPIDADPAPSVELSPITPEAQESFDTEFGGDKFIGMTPQGITFVDPNGEVNTMPVDQAAQFLGVTPEDFTKMVGNLTTKSPDTVLKAVGDVQGVTEKTFVVKEGGKDKRYTRAKYYETVMKPMGVSQDEFDAALEKYKKNSKNTTPVFKVEIATVGLKESFRKHFGKEVIIGTYKVLWREKKGSKLKSITVQNEQGEKLGMSMAELSRITGMTTSVIGRKISDTPVIPAGVSLLGKIAPSVLPTVVKNLRGETFYITYVFHKAGEGFAVARNEGSAAYLVASGYTMVYKMDEGQLVHANLGPAVMQGKWDHAFELKTSMVPKNKVTVEMEEKGGNIHYFYYENMENQHYSLEQERIDAEYEEYAKSLGEYVPGEGTTPADAIEDMDNRLEINDLIEHIDVTYDPKNKFGIRYLWQRFRKIGMNGLVIKSHKDIAALFSIYRHPRIEQSTVIFLDEKGNVIDHLLMSLGHSSATTMPSKTVGELATKLNAAKVYATHNHPTGDIEPSGADKTVHRNLREVLGDKYAGNIIFDHDQYNFTSPNVYLPTAFDYDTSQQYEENTSGVAAGRRAKKLIDKYKKEGSDLIFVTDYHYRLIAAIQPSKELSGIELERIRLKYGGAFTVLVTDNYDRIETRANHSVITVGENGAYEGFYYTKNGHPLDTTSMDSQTSILMESASDLDHTPSSVAAYETFWKNVVAKYGIERPQGVSILNFKKEYDIDTIGHKGKVTINVEKIDTDVVAHITVHGGDDGADLVIDYKIMQGEDELDVVFSGEGDHDAGLINAWKSFLESNLDDLVEEGPNYDYKHLKLSKTIREAWDDYKTRKNWYMISPILDMQKNTFIKDKLVLFAEYLQELDPNSREAKFIKKAMWEMAVLRVALEGMSSTGIKKLKYKLGKMAYSSMTPEQLKTSFKSVLFGDFRVRLPFTKQNKELFDKLSAMDKEKWTPQDRDFMAWAELPSVETLSFQDLYRLKDFVDNYLQTRLGNLKVDLGKSSMPLQALIQAATEELQQRNGEKKTFDPAQAMKKKTLRNAGILLKHYLIDKMKPFYYLVEHVAGIDSLVYDVLFANMNKNYTEFISYKQYLTDLYGRELEKNGLSYKDVLQWNKQTRDIGNTKLTNQQAMEIYLHSLAEDNWKSILAKGMYYTDREGARVHMSPEVVNFQAIADEMANDDMAKSVGASVRVMMDDLGSSVKDLYERLFKREWKWEENYYPKKVAREDLEFGQEEMRTKDAAGNPIISLVKSFNIERTGEESALELNVNGYAHTLAMSVEREAKFVKMELALFQASKLIYDPEFKSAVTNAKGLGKSYWDLLEKGLQDVAGKSLDIKNDWDKVLLKLRNQASRAGIGLNPFSAAKAATSYFYAIRYLDPGSAMVGLGEAMKRGQIKYLMMKSAVFRERLLGGALPEMADVFKGDNLTMIQKGLPQYGTKDFDRIAYSFISFVDSKTVSAVMLGAMHQFTKAAEEGHLTIDMKEALRITEADLKTMSPSEIDDASIAYADWVVMKTQPDFRPMSRNSYQRGTPIERLFSVFGSFVQITHNWAYDLMYRISKDGLEGVGVKEMVMAFALMSITAGGNEGVERLKNLLLARDNRGLWEIIQTQLLGNTFIIRDLNQMFFNAVKYGPYSSSGTPDLFTDFTSLIIRGGVMTVDGVLNDSQDDILAGISSVVEGLSFFVGLPVAATSNVADAIGNRQNNQSSYF